MEQMEFPGDDERTMLFFLLTNDMGYLSLQQATSKIQFTLDI